MTKGKGLLYPTEAAAVLMAVGVQLSNKGYMVVGSMHACLQREGEAA